MGPKEAIRHVNHCTVYFTQKINLFLFKNKWFAFVFPGLSGDTWCRLTLITQSQEEEFSCLLSPPSHPSPPFRILLIEEQKNILRQFRSYSSQPELTCSHPSSPTFKLPPWNRKIRVQGMKLQHRACTCLLADSCAAFLGTGATHHNPLTLNSFRDCLFLLLPGKWGWGGSEASWCSWCSHVSSLRPSSPSPCYSWWAFMSVDWHMHPSTSH